MVKIKWKRSKIILFQTENKIILLTPLADYFACSKTLLWLLLDLRIVRYFGWKRDKKNLSKKSIFCSARCWPIKVVWDLVGRDVMGLNGFKGANTRHVFCSSGGGMWKCQVGGWVWERGDWSVGERADWWSRPPCLCGLCLLLYLLVLSCS